MGDFAKIMHDNRSKIIQRLIEGRSRGYIAKEIGVTRSSLAGFIWRNSEEFAVVKMTKPPKEIKPICEIKKRKNLVKKVVKERKIKDDVLAKTKPSHGVPIIPEHGQCKFPIGNYPFINCDDNAVKNRSYCEHHYKLCHVKNAKEAA